MIKMLYYNFSDLEFKPDIPTPLYQNKKTKIWILTFAF